MKSLGYLLITTIKNYFKDMKNHPSKLITNLIIVLFFGFILFSSVSSRNLSGENFRDIKELYAIVLLLYGFMFIPSVLKGFSSGASFYSMADVNFLFSVPISSKKILFYGLIKQMGTSLFLGFFLLFQYSWLNMTYGLTGIGLVIILLGYCIVMFSGQITSMAIYSFTSSDENRKKVLKGILVFLAVLVVGYILMPVLKSGAIVLGDIVKSANSKTIELVPIIGWVKGIAIGILSGNISSLILGAVLTITYNALIILFIVKSRGDYYEDVLKATEVSFSAITAKKEGKVGEVLPSKVKVGKTGIGKGKGAITFFYKHMLEDRRAKLFILDKMSLLMILFCIIFAVALKDVGIMAIFAFAIYMQFITAFTSGRWVKELILPYVYMVPVSPFKKLIMISLQGVYKSLIESIILFVPIGIIVNASILEIAVCIVSRVGFAVLFMSGNTLATRVLGSVSNKIIIMMVFLIIMIILCIPGMLLGLLISSVFNFIPSVVAILIGTIISNTLIAALITFLCKDILNYAELNNK